MDHVKSAEFAFAFNGLTEGLDDLVLELHLLPQRLAILVLLLVVVVFLDRTHFHWRIECLGGGHLRNGNGGQSICEGAA